MKNSHLIYFIGLFILLSGCNPVYYVPNTHNVPLLDGEKDGVLAIHTADHQGEFQAAFALSSNVAIMANGALIKPNNDDKGDGGKGNFLEGGVGYYKKISDFFVFENYALLGFANVENHFPSTLVEHPESSGKIKTHFLKYGLQPSVGFKSKFLEAALSLRLSGLQYYGTSGGLIFENENQTTYIHKNRQMFLAEPALTVRAGYDFLKLQVQWGLSHNFTNPDFRQEKGYVTFGLIWRFNK